MKTKLHYLFVALALCSTLNLQLSTVFAQGTAFTYQGQLASGGGSANGSYDLTFTLFNTNSSGVALAGPVTNSATAVNNGLFTTTIDFGSGVFTGGSNWLEIAVRTNGNGSFTTLTPRLQLTPTPYALFANTASNLSGTVSTTQLDGTIGNSQLANGSITVTAGTGLGGGGTVTLGGSTTLNNAGVVSVTGNADITANTAGGAVTLGDTATSTNTPSTIVKRDAGGNFSAASITLDNNFNLPTTTATAGIIYSGGSTLMHTFGSNNFFAGVGAGNLTMTGVGRNTGLGMLDFASNTTGSNNTAIGWEAFQFNTTGNGNTANGVIALEHNTTGNQNTAHGDTALYSNTSGSDNTANGWSALANNTTGSDNTASGWSALANNTTGIQNTANGYGALQNNLVGIHNTAIGYQALFSNTNGNYNEAIGYQSLYANMTGSSNAANGDWALNRNTTGANNTASGHQALYANTNGIQNTADGDSALHNNTSGTNNIAVGYFAGSSFTGNESDNIDIGNLGVTGENDTIRIGDPTIQTATYLAGTVYANGVALTSDRNAKENFAAVNAREVLAKVASLPVTEWNYKTDSKHVQHIGPMAQDFQAAFQLSADDKHISVVDEGGVALAAIQGLNQKLNEKDMEIQTLKTQNDSLAERLSELEVTVKQLAAIR